MGVLDNLLDNTNKKGRDKENAAYLAQLSKRVDRINALEAEMEDSSDDEMQAKTTEFRQRLADGEDLNGPLLEEAFAVVREAAWCVAL